MSDGAIQTRDEIAATYLQQLQELAGELSNATDAIASNAISRFQESVAKQEVLCASLASMANRVSEGFGSPDQLMPSCSDTSIRTRIRVAGDKVRELNQNYSALLRHSGRSIAMLASLCRSHTGHFQEAHGPRSKHQTWSCEM